MSNSATKRMIKFEMARQQLQSAIEHLEELQYHGLAERAMNLKADISERMDEEEDYREQQD